MRVRARDSSGRRRELEVAPRQVPEHRLLLFADRIGPRGVVVAQGRRLGDVPVLELLAVLLVGRPLAVRRLVVGHEEERLVLRPVLEQVDGEVGDDVGDVALDAPPAVLVVEGRIVVDALPGQDVPVVEARRVAAQVPLADHGGVVAGLLQHLRHGRLRTVEAVEDRHAVQVAVLAGEDRGPARRADRVGREQRSIRMPSRASRSRFGVWLTRLP